MRRLDLKSSANCRKANPSAAMIMCAGRRVFVNFGTAELLSQATTKPSGFLRSTPAVEKNSKNTLGATPTNGTKETLLSSRLSTLMESAYSSKTKLFGNGSIYI